MPASAHQISRVNLVEYEMLAQVAQIEAEAFGQGGLNEWTLPVIVRHGYLFVLTFKKRIVGNLSAVRSVKPQTAFIIDLAVKKEYRQLGLGRQLLLYALEQFKKDGLKVVQLTVAPENKVAIKLYQSLGFKKQAVLKDEYGPGRDRFLMTWVNAETA